MTDKSEFDEGGDCIKKLIALVLALVCVLGLAGCRLNQPDFENFQEYEDDFVAVKNFLVDFNVSRNDTSRLLIDIGSQLLSIKGTDISDSTIEDSVKSIYDKGFTYIEIDDDYIIFWEDETGYYGVLWSANPQKAISQKKEDARPYMNMKSKKLANEWCEIGALDSI